MKGIKKMALVITAIIAIVIVIFVLLDGSLITKQYALVWNEKYIDQIENQQEKIITYALRAQSSHNMQPWKIKIISDNSIELYADMNKALNVVDSNNTQMLISQGTFIEAYTQAAEAFGFIVHTEYVKPNFTSKNSLVAKLSLSENNEKNKSDIIAGSSVKVAILNQSNQVSNIETKMNSLLSENESIRYEIIDSNELAKFQEYLLEATIIESTNEKAMKELLSVFRWTERDKNNSKYGMTLTNIPMPLKPFIQVIMKMSSNNWQSFGEKGIEIFRDRLKKEHTYVMLKCSNPKYIDYISVGRVYQDMIFSFSDNTIRPAHQVLEKFSAMNNINQCFQDEYGSNSEVLLIVGLKDKTDLSNTLTPRHLVDEIIVK